MMERTPRNLIPSGVEPVDKLIGGLESTSLYLVHGEAAGKSLFGIQFLIEGLKRGENGALVIRYSLEDAVQRFARLGYDCLEDVYSGRLVILEYSDDIIQQISRLRELTPVLRELEWVLGETRPQRLLFDPVTSLVLGEEGNIESRTREFADWASSFGATVVMVSNDDNPEVIDSFRPIVAEVFRFEIRETADRAIRFLAFEKSVALADQAIEVDPSRGVFLLGRTQVKEEMTAPLGTPPQTAPLKQATEIVDGQAGEPVNAPQAEYDFSELLEPLRDLPLAEEASAVGTSPEETRVETEEHSLDTSVLDPQVGQRARAAFELSETGPTAESAHAGEDLSKLIEELSKMASPLDLDIPELEVIDQQAEQHQSEPQPETYEEPGQAQAEAERAEIKQPEVEPASAGQPEQEQPKAASPVIEEAQPVATATESQMQTPKKRARAADSKIDSALAQRAAEILLRPPDLQPELSTTGPFAQTIAASRPVLKREQAVEADPKDFNILIIDDDQPSREQIAQALREYNVEIVNDGVSGLAKLISFKPDLVLLDVDLPIVDGFKVLAHIRSSLNMPVIIVSGTRVRASDRVMSAELGADYFLTKPFSVKELQQKARQLIARFRGINSWIVTAPAERHSVERRPVDSPTGERVIEPVIMSIESGGDQFTPYGEFAGEVERKVREAMDEGAPFSIVGCRLPQMTANGGRVALRLHNMISTLVRDTDLISTNPRNDLVILLTDADASGARAFIKRLGERVSVEMNQEPAVWMRSFPELEEASDAARTAQPSINGKPSGGRRAGDDPAQTNRIDLSATDAPAELVKQPARSEAQTDISKRPDPRASYIDFLEQL